MKKIEFAPSEEEVSLWDAATVDDWDTPDTEWWIEKVMPKGGVGFLSGPPKGRKSLLALDMSVSMILRHPWLLKYGVCRNIEVPKILYIAREDPAWRVKNRLQEIRNSYDHVLIPREHLMFLIRDRFNLLDDTWIDWLKQCVDFYGFNFLILDVLNRMIPGLDELGGKDMGLMIDRLEEINRSLGVTILCLDHTRKPPIENGNTYAAPSPYDLKGSMAKFGCADFIICVVPDKDDESRIMVYSENKDTDAHQSFYIKCAPQGSEEPKFKWDATAVSDDKRCGKVLLETLTSRWEKPTDVYERIKDFSERTIRNCFRRLEKQKKVERRGHTNNVEWRKKIEREPIEELDVYDAI